MALLYTAIIVAIIAVLLVAGFSIFLSADNGTDFVDQSGSIRADPKETYLALGGCGLILVALVIVSIFVYTAIS